MEDTAEFKIDRAEKHIEELIEFLKEYPPFTYALGTSIQTGYRATYAKRDFKLAAKASVICGDAIHNLRSALDHVYWTLISPFAFSEKEKQSIQFPFSRMQSGVERILDSEPSNRAPTSLLQSIRDLKPYAEEGGNANLYLVHSLDIIDKHKSLLALPDYSQITNASIRAQVPDFPGGIEQMIGMNGVDVAWYLPSPVLECVGEKHPENPDWVERALDVPVIATLPFRNGQSLVPSLLSIIAEVRTAVESIRNA